jgi:hypothetical protein
MWNKLITTKPLGCYQLIISLCVPTNLFDDNARGTSENKGPVNLPVMHYLILVIQKIFQTTLHGIYFNYATSMLIL